MGVGKEDLVGGVVNGQGTGPLQLGGDEGSGVGTIHTNPANVGSVPPVCPIQPAAGRENQMESQF